MKMEANLRIQTQPSLEGHTEVKKCRASLAVVFFVIAFITASGLSSTASVQDVAPPLQEEVSPSISTHDEPVIETSSIWRSFLWEALPVEWINDPRKHAILEAYQQNGWKPFFIDSGFEVSDQGRALMQRLETLADDAIDPKPYQIEALQKSVQNLDQLRHSLEAADPRFRDHVTLVLENSSSDTSISQSTAAPATQYAANAPTVPPVGIPMERVDKQKIKEFLQAAGRTDVQLAIRLVRYARDMDPSSQDVQFKVLSGDISFDEFMKRLVPGIPHYEVLREALKKYERLAAGGFQQPIHETVSLRLGDRGNSISILQKHLQQEGFYDGKIDGYFDAVTQAAVQKFQLSHLLEADGVVGPRTKDWLNVSYKDKAEMIASSLRLLRQSESRRYDRFVRINVPQFMLEYYNDNKLESAHRVIIGRATGKKIKFQGQMIGENHTPSLVSSIESIDFNPRWYVSDRIRRELSDEIAADPNYLVKNGYVKMSSHYPWGEPRLFQLPGPNNPLGQVRFDFPNAYAVYLHDTPKKHLFQRTRRDFSHGCIRMERAREFAKLILEGEQNAAAEKVESYLDNNYRQVIVRLQRPIPIVIEYIPVSSDVNKQVLFCGDLYGRY